MNQFVKWDTTTTPCRKTTSFRPVRKLFYLVRFWTEKKVKVKPLILHHLEQVLTSPVGLIRRFQSEQFRALLRVKTTRNWLWRVKDIPHAIRSLTLSQSQTQAEARTWTQALAVRGERVTTASQSRTENSDWTWNYSSHRQPLYNFLWTSQKWGVFLQSELACVTNKVSYLPV